MSSFHESSRDTARDAQGREQRAGAVPTPSYSSHFHLNYVTTFHDTQNRAGDSMVHRIVYSCRPATETGSLVAQVQLSIISEINLKDKSEESGLRSHASAIEPALAPAPDDHRPPEKPESANDTLKSVREKRTEVLNKMFGIWKDRADIPEGLQFQQAMRDEWR